MQQALVKCSFNLTALTSLGIQIVETRQHKSNHLLFRLQVNKDTNSYPDMLLETSFVWPSSQTSGGLPH
jgi:hypothetical protein